MNTVTIVNVTALRRDPIPRRLR